MKKKNKRGKKEVLTEDLTEKRSQLGVAQVSAADSMKRILLQEIRQSIKLFNMLPLYSLF